MKNISLNDHFEQYIVENKDGFSETLAHCMLLQNITLDKEIKKHVHHKYFTEYLYDERNHDERRGFKASTIIVEKEYTSLSYLGDFINYYSKLYKTYPKTCRRIHFFNDVISYEQFINIITDKKSKYIDYFDSYLGYIVIKPLPVGIIGATLLKHYDNKPGRHYTVTRDYPVNIFGRELIVKSLPYQEQDGIVGSCASSALWSAFQQTSGIFHSPILNPSDITLSAGSKLKGTGKTFPSSDLEIGQICQAIQATGLISELESDLTRLRDTKLVKLLLYAYLRMGIPVLMGMSLEEGGETEEERNHLVTVNGYRFGSPVLNTDDDNSKVRISLKSSDIVKFYAHDDQTGPFSRIDFIENPTDYQVQTSYWEDINSDVTLKANIRCIIVPIPKILAVNFEDILDIATVLDGKLRFLINGEDYTWDLYLIESNTYKDEIKSELVSQDVDQENFSILYKSLPQHIWVIKSYNLEGNLLFDMLYDAKDKVSLHPFEENIYNSSFKEMLKVLDVSDIASILTRDDLNFDD